MLSKISINIIVWMTEVWISNFLLYVIIKCNDKKTYMYDLHKAGAPDTLSARKEFSNQLHNILHTRERDFRCYETKQRRVKKLVVAGIKPRTPCLCSHAVLCHWATTNRQPPVLTIHYLYCTGGAEMPWSHTWSTQYVPSELCMIGVDQKILSIRIEPMLSGFSHSKCLNHLASR